jgi:predicted esterase
MNICKHIKQLPAHKQICFIHGEEDTLIPAHHAQKLYDAFPGRKMLI